MVETFDVEDVEANLNLCASYIRSTNDLFSGDPRLAARLASLETMIDGVLSDFRDAAARQARAQGEGETKCRQTDDRAIDELGGAE